MAKLLGIDVGTSGCKLIVVDEVGRILREASRTYPIEIPQQGWTQQDPEQWWSAVQACLIELDTPDLDGIGLTGQMHGSVFLDADGTVIRPAILWNDQRTVKECAEITEKVGQDSLLSITGNPMLTGFQLPKIIWLRNNEPKNFEKVATVLLPKDFIRFKLTGIKATDVSDASGTGAFDVPHRKWSTEILEKLDLNQNLFPPSFESDEVTGKTIAGLEGLKDGIPVVAGGGDQAAAAVGTGAVKVGITSVSLGTSGVVFTSLESPRSNPAGAVHTFCHANRKWHAMGVTLSCGGALKWGKDTLFADLSYDEITALASESMPGAAGLTFLPYLTGERSPHNDPGAKATFAGITLGSQRKDFARALLEGISFSLFDAFTSLRDLGASATELRVTSGGARSIFWLQLLADIFNANCVTLEIDEGPAFGAALLAAVGIGIFKDVEEAASSCVRIRKTVSPSGKTYATAWSSYQQLYPALKSWNLKDADSA